MLIIAVRIDVSCFQYRFDFASRHKAPLLVALEQGIAKL